MIDMFDGNSIIYLFHINSMIDLLDKNSMITSIKKKIYLFHINSMIDLLDKNSMIASPLIIFSLMQWCLRTNSPWLTPGFDVILLMQSGAQFTRWVAKFSYDHFLNGTLLNLEYCFVFVCPGSCGFDLVPYWWCDCSYWVNGVLLCVDKDIYYTYWHPTSLERGGYLIR